MKITPELGIVPGSYFVCCIVSEELAMQSISTIGLDIAKSKYIALMQPAKWSYAGS
jgi:hypothetical protein